MDRDMASDVKAQFESLDYGPALERDLPARKWLAYHNASFGHFINGEFTPLGKKTLLANEPATGKKLATFSHGGKAAIKKAAEAAAKAQPGWWALGPGRRARVIYGLARMVQRNARLFAVLETLDNGKPIRETRDIDIPLVARHFYHHAGWAQLQDSEFSGHVPVGVVGQIVPWNFPLLMFAWKVAPALSLGNTVVIKPAEQTPLTALLFAELATRAGLPKGVLNVVTGDGKTGSELVKSPNIDKIAFTGSTDVGRSIRKLTAGTGKHLTLELGGKSPFVVFDDADLDAAVEGVVDGVWFNQGQVCCAGSRLLVQESVASKMHAKLKRRLDTMRVGRPLDKNTDVGAIITKTQFNRINRLVKEGVEDGGKLHQSKQKCKGGGYFYPPTLLADTPQASKAAIEEIFGPVLVSTSFRTHDEAVELANNTRYGLAASVFTETIGLALDIAPRLAAGVVWVNSTNLFDASSGFGGYRESGFGREGGHEGAFEYLKPRDWEKRKPRKVSKDKVKAIAPGDLVGNVDRTAKHFIGGKQKRPDGGYSYAVCDKRGRFVAEAASGNRKDVRDAVETARKMDSWSRMDVHARAQVMYFLAENLDARKDEFATRLALVSGHAKEKAKKEVETSVDRLFTYAAWCDKYEGRVHELPQSCVALAMPEPLGVVGLACPEEAPLLSFVSLAGALLSAGNRVVALPSVTNPLAATDFYQVIETSDLPAGTLNIITGPHKDTLPTLASHLDVDALWVFGTKEESKLAEELSAENLKRTFVDHGLSLDWHGKSAHGREFLRRAVQVKNIWVPYGE